jgi:phosphate starvation-inducible PhoH-like protein
MSRDREKEEKDFKDLTSVNSQGQIEMIKAEIAKFLPNDIKLLAKNESQKKLINSIKNNEITICSGNAGTGKTYVALAYALSLLRKTSNRYKKIYLVKSVTTLKGEELGFLKGDMKEKIDPFMWSFYINMEKLILESAVKELLVREIIRPFPLAYMRGASLDDCIIIADEMQNVTLDNSLTLLTRIGSNSKLILLGDIHQIDMKNKHESSLETITDMFEDIPNIGVIRMSTEDTNVRNPLITIIENKYKEYMKVPKAIRANKQLLVETTEKRTFNSKVDFTKFAGASKECE